MTRRRDDVTNSMKRLKRHTDQKSRVVVLDATTFVFVVQYNLATIIIIYHLI
uniref:Uncharacterized protein n=1 Tax=Rhizophagus irregularis (strain DAOM 181602 / DAOM 197198 / MUCL 43194) TaxID=747089 RepID=U9TLP5_RHIID